MSKPFQRKPTIPKMLPPSAAKRGTRFPDAETVAEAVRAFQARGGLIQELPPQPDLRMPSRIHPLLGTYENPLSF